METTTSTAWSKVKSRVHETVSYLPVFLKAPVTQIQRAPNWDVWNALLLLIIVTIPSGILGGLMARNFMNVLWGIFLLPFVTVFFTALISFGFYYAFVTIFKSKTDPTKVFVIVVLASIPLLIVRIFVPFAPPLSPIGVVCSGALLAVGFVDNFGLPRQKVFKLIGTLLALFVVFWIFQMIQAKKNQAKFNPEIPTDALQQLEREMNEATD